jgi:hypothetical protein
MARKNKASCRSLQNQTVAIEYNPIQQTPGKRCTVTFAGGAFWNSTLWPDQEGQASGRSSSSAYIVSIQFLERILFMLLRVQSVINILKGTNIISII